MTKHVTNFIGEDPAEFDCCALDASVVDFSRPRKGSPVIIPLHPDDDPAEVIAELNERRDWLDRATDLMERALDLREQLQWGVFDADDARAAVAEFKRDCRVHRRRRLG